MEIYPRKERSISVSQSSRNLIWSLKTNYFWRAAWHNLSCSAMTSAINHYSLRFTQVPHLKVLRLWIQLKAVGMMVMCWASTPPNIDTMGFNDIQEGFNGDLYNQHGTQKHILSTGKRIVHRHLWSGCVTCQSWPVHMGLPDIWYPVPSI